MYEWSVATTHTSESLSRTKQHKKPNPEYICGKKLTAAGVLHFVRSLETGPADGGCSWLEAWNPFWGKSNKRRARGRLAQQISDSFMGFAMLCHSDLRPESDCLR